MCFNKKEEEVKLVVAQSDLEKEIVNLIEQLKTNRYYIINEVKKLIKEEESLEEIKYSIVYSIEDYDGNIYIATDSDASPKYLSKNEVNKHIREVDGKKYYVSYKYVNSESWNYNNARALNSMAGHTNGSGVFRLEIGTKLNELASSEVKDMFLKQVTDIVSYGEELIDALSKSVRAYENAEWNRMKNTLKEFETKEIPVVDITLKARRDGQSSDEYYLSVLREIQSFLKEKEIVDIQFISDKLPVVKNK